MGSLILTLLIIMGNTVALVFWGLAVYEQGWSLYSITGMGISLLMIVVFGGYVVSVSAE